MAARHRYEHWTPERVAFAALLAGLGRADEEIAAHPNVDSTPEAVRRRLRLVGVAAIRADNSYAVRIPSSALSVFRAAAAARHTTAESVVREAIFALGKDATLLDNILDDGVATVGHFGGHVDGNGK